MQVLPSTGCNNVGFGVLLCFPERLQMFTQQGVNRRAVKTASASECFNPRDFTHDKHRTVDDRPLRWWFLVC